MQIDPTFINKNHLVELQARYLFTAFGSLLNGRDHYEERAPYLRASLSNPSPSAVVGLILMTHGFDVSSKAWQKRQENVRSQRAKLFCDEGTICL